MRITIPGGAGDAGAPMTRRPAAGGHSITVAFGRDPTRLEAVAREAGGRVAPDPTRAAADADVVALAVPRGAAEAARAAAGGLSVEAVWDCTNPPSPDSGGLALGATAGGGEGDRKSVV